MNLTLRERYQPGSSPLHRLDPRVKVVITLALIVGVVMTPEHAWPAYPLLWALIGTLAATGQIGVLRLARLGGVALPFALAAITLLFTTPGDPVAHILGQTITDAGLLRVAAILLKSWLAVQATLILAMTTPFTDLLWALGALRVPPMLILITAVMYRYLFTLQDEAARLLRARAARSGAIPGRHAGGTFGWRARTAGSMIGSLFVRSAERSERVYAAMLARGYRGEMRVLDAPPLTRRALLWGALPVGALVLIEGLALLLWSR